MSIQMGNTKADELLKWIQESIRSQSNQYNHGYQAHTYLFENAEVRLIIKVPMGWGLTKLFRRWMLYREFQAYQRLSGIKGIPTCHGFLNKEFLVLEFIDGIPFRGAKISNHNLFYQTFLELIQSMHRAGVAHSDLKKKDNLLVVDKQFPYIIDFGAAVLKKSGFSLLNRILYHHAKKFDLNAWIKLKYNRKTDGISEKDKEYFNRTLVETIAHSIKKTYIRIKKIFIESKH